MLHEIQKVIFEYGKIRDPLTQRQVLGDQFSVQFKDSADWSNEYINKAVREGMEEKLNEIALKSELRKQISAKNSNVKDVEE